MKMLMNEKPKRKHKRLQIAVPVIYEYSGGAKIVSKQSTTFDLSEGGMGFYSEKPLQKGIKIQVHLPYIWNFPKSSQVRWCSMKSYNLYRVGVSFKQKIS